MLGLVVQLELQLGLWQQQRERGGSVGVSRAEQAEWECVQPDHPNEVQCPSAQAEDKRAGRTSGMTTAPSTLCTSLPSPHGISLQWGSWADLRVGSLALNYPAAECHIPWAAALAKSQGRERAGDWLPPTGNGATQTHFHGGGPCVATSSRMAGKDW